MPNQRMVVRKSIKIGLRVREMWEIEMKIQLKGRQYNFTLKNALFPPPKKRKESKGKKKKKRRKHFSIVLFHRAAYRY
jgi:hypothetical protein